MRIVVTGATGFIGGKLARELVKRGETVVTVARDPAKAADLTALGVEVHKGDITDKASLVTPMRGADQLYHVAGWYKVGVRDGSPGQKINVEGTRHVLEVMRDAGVSKGVYTSTLAIYSDTHGVAVDESYRFTGTHISEYDRTKADAHKIAEEFIAAGLPLVIVQPGTVIGPDDTSGIRDTLIGYLQRRLPLIPAGQSFAWAHVDDIVEGHLLAMARGRVGESYHISGDVMTLVDALDLAATMTGIPAPTLRPGAGFFRVMAGIMGVVDRVVPVEGQFNPEMLRILSGVTYIASNAKARRELGYDPRPLKDALRETLAHEMRLLGMTMPTH
ncbi:MAG: NAD-dependent epimerase/dehydratase family protein [Chloroflexota bacterium]|nr:NAD-dependent epimerase/dehydratase family protein [Chloroflexota bacterium]